MTLFSPPPRVPLKVYVIDTSILFILFELSAEKAIGKAPCRVERFRVRLNTTLLENLEDFVINCTISPNSHAHESKPNIRFVLFNMEYNTSFEPTIYQHSTLVSSAVDEALWLYHGCKRAPTLFKLDELLPGFLLEWQENYPQSYQYLDISKIFRCQVSDKTYVYFNDPKLKRRPTQRHSLDGNHPLAYSTPEEATVINFSAFQQQLAENFPSISYHLVITDHCALATAIKTQTTTWLRVNQLPTRGELLCTATQLDNLTDKIIKADKIATLVDLDHTLVQRLDSACANEYDLVSNHTSLRAQKEVAGKNCVLTPWVVECLKILKQGTGTNRTTVKFYPCSTRRFFSPEPILPTSTDIINARLQQAAELALPLHNPAYFTRGSYHICEPVYKLDLICTYSELAQISVGNPTQNFLPDHQLCKNKFLANLEQDLIQLETNIIQQSIAVIDFDRAANLTDLARQRAELKKINCHLIQLNCYLGTRYRELFTNTDFSTSTALPTALITAEQSVLEQKKQQVVTLQQRHAQALHTLTAIAPPELLPGTLLILLEDQPAELYSPAAQQAIKSLAARDYSVATLEVAKQGQLTEANIVCLKSFMHSYEASHISAAVLHPATLQAELARKLEESQRMREDFLLVAMGRK